MIDISELIVNNAEYIEQAIEYGFVAYIGGNLLPSQFVDKVTKHFPLSDIIRDYIKGKGNTDSLS